MNAQLTVGSLFSGIGGFDLGLERAGMRTVWLCERDDFCRRVLAKHWPGVPCYRDVCALQRTVPDVSRVDVLCGGFPCQDLSYAGKGAGLHGTRSGLWSEYARLIGELRPRYVIVENVAALLARGLSRVLGDLAALGYDAEWDCIPASAVGAPHRRDRLWLVAYPNSEGQSSCSVDAQEGRRLLVQGGSGGPDLAYSSWDLSAGATQAGAERQRTRASGQQGSGRSDYWVVEPGMGRVAHGVPDRVDRLRSLGNALVPQIAEWIGARIIAYEEAA